MQLSANTAVSCFKSYHSLEKWFDLFCRLSQGGRARYSQLHWIKTKTKRRRHRICYSAIAWRSELSPWTANSSFRYKGEWNLKILSCFYHLSLQTVWRSDGRTDRQINWIIEVFNSFLIFIAQQHLHCQEQFGRETYRLWKCSPHQELEGRRYAGYCKLCCVHR